MRAGAGLEEMKRFNGVVKFPGRPQSSYQFELTVDGETLSIWLKDRTTKTQMTTPPLKLDDIVKTGSAIPKETFVDYAKLFAKCLDSPPESHEFIRALVPVNSGEAVELQLTRKIQSSTTTQTFSFSFRLEEVQVDRLDVLQAKIRDQDEQIRKLQTQVQNLTDLVKNMAPKRQPVYTNATVW